MTTTAIRSRSELIESATVAADGSITLIVPPPPMFRRLRDNFRNGAHPSLALRRFRAVTAGLCLDAGIMPRVGLVQVHAVLFNSTAKRLPSAHIAILHCIVSSVVFDGTQIRPFAVSREPDDGPARLEIRVSWIQSHGINSDGQIPCTHEAAD